MNEYIKKYISQITPERFEELCVEYLRILKGPTYKIRGTRYCKDGGRDAVGTISDNIPYEIWAECKKHSRSIGLEDISKNVVLVLSENINELIFFSTSNITSNAQKHISNLGARHNFAVAFYYGDNLYEALSSLEIFRINTKNNVLAESTESPLTVTFGLTQYENSDSYEETNTITLNRDTIFYIDIQIRNHSSNIINDICCTIPACNNALFYTNKFDKNFKLAPYCERFLQLKVKVLNCKQKFAIPPIEINYHYEDDNKSIQLRNCFVDPTRLIYFPLVGVDINNNLKKKIEPLLSEKTRNSYLIDVRGCSGVGKSRFIKEVLSLADSYDWHIKSYDGKKEQDLKIVKDLLAYFIGIPYYCGNINFTPGDIKNILINQGDNESYAEILYNFIYTEKLDSDTLYYIEEAFLYFLKKPYLDCPYIIAIDNIQDLDHSMIEFLKHIVNELEHTPTKFILIIGINTEIIPIDNADEINFFLNNMDDLSDDFHRSYPLGDMKKEDAETLYIHALKNLKQDASFLNKMIRKAGTRPFDIIMHIKYLQEKNLIKWLGNDSWYIDDFDLFEEFIEGIPLKSEKLIAKRIKLQKNIYSEDEWNVLKILMKAIVYFEDSLPLEFVEEIQVNEDLLFQFMDSLLIKFDDINPEIHFYHHNIYLYLKSISIYKFDKRLANIILLWIENNSINNFKSTQFQCLIDVGNYTEAKEIGIKYLTESMDSYNFNMAIRIADKLIDNPKIILSPKENFDIKYAKADACRERLDHEKGAALFWELFQYLQENMDVFDTDELQCQFFHKAINANLNSNYPDRAKNILSAFSKINIPNLYYKFILLDRYAVAHLALGELEHAKKKLDQAMQIAQEANDPTWLGIIYSDKAYFYYRGMQDAKNTKEYFRRAYDIQFDERLDYNRQGELLQQKAFAELLMDNIELSMKMVNRSIDVCRKIHCTYLEVKAINLKGIIEIKNNHFEKALSIWMNGLDLCRQIKDLVCQIRIYINIGAMYLSTGRIEHLYKAEENLLIALKLFEQHRFSPSSYKELFYNIVRLLYTQKKSQKINELLEKWGFRELYDFVQNLDEETKQLNYGILLYNNINFIF